MQDLLHGLTTRAGATALRHGERVRRRRLPSGRSVDDQERIAFIHGHLEATLQAIAEGVNVAGYFHWSLMDNFEWAEGYRRRFGLHYVEFGSGRRIAEAQCPFYRRLAQTGVLPDTGTPDWRRTVALP